MAIKSSNVIARVEPELKDQAEKILAQLGLPVSVVINALYRQIILKKGIPFSMTLSAGMPVREEMSEAEFASMMERGLRQAKNNESVPLEAAFDQLMREM